MKFLLLSSPIFGRKLSLQGKEKGLFRSTRRLTLSNKILSKCYEIWREGRAVEDGEKNERRVAAKFTLGGAV